MILTDNYPHGMIDSVLGANVDTAAGHWTIVRETLSFVTVGRTVTDYENGMLIGVSREQLTVFSNGDVLFYQADDTYPEAPWFGVWERVRDMATILQCVTAPSSRHTVDY